MNANKTDPSTETHRFDGRLHLLHHVRDEAGNLITTVTGPLKVEFRLEDIGQLVAGACVMALPVSLTEEVWELGKNLSIAHTLIILAVSLITLAGFTWGLFYGKRIGEYKGHFFKRVLSAYVVTFLVALLLLFLFDQAPLDDLRTTLTRTIIVAFPASFAATAMDFLKQVFGYSALSDDPYDMLLLYWIAMIVNIAIALLVMLTTTVMHLAGISLVVMLLKTQADHWRYRHSFVWAQKIGEVVLLMLFFSFLEIWVWAGIYLLVGAVEKMEAALYFSMVTFTTLGYGDVLLDERWRLMAAFEAANGIIIFGLTTAVVVAVVQRVYFTKTSG